MEKKADIYKIDEFIALKPANTGGVRWFLPFEAPLRLSGFAWFEHDMRYDRFPVSPIPATVTQFGTDGKPVAVKWEECGAALLSPHTAGGQIQFRSDSPRLLIRGEVTSPEGMDHMAFTGSAGFDLYLTGADGRRRMVGVTRYDHSKTEFTAEVITGMAREMRTFLIHFPLYNGVKSLYIGIDDQSEMLPPPAWEEERPIVAYGTSILQGGCASRPGMAYTNILSRKLNRKVLNFGFSGSGKGEPEIAEILSRIETPSMYILDFDWNVPTGAAMGAALPGFLDRLRKRHPEVPILVISHTPSGPWSQAQSVPSPWPARTRAQADEVARRRAAGDGNIHYLDGMTLLGEDWDECLVDGCHATDLGFYRMAEGILPAVKSMLKIQD